jgi:hemoglobin
MLERSLYERIGGESAVRTTVLKMYDKILDDPALAPFFENIDVERLRLSQSAFVTFAFGGPNHYNGKSLRAAHRHSVQNGLSDSHFDKVAQHLQAAMEELSVPANLIAEALAIVGSTRADVLNKSGGSA